MVPKPALASNILAVVELILLIVLGVEIVKLGNDRPAILIMKAS